MGARRCSRRAPRSDRENSSDASALDDVDALRWVDGTAATARAVSGAWRCVLLGILFEQGYNGVTIAPTEAAAGAWPATTLPTCRGWADMPEWGVALWVLEPMWEVDDVARRRGRGRRGSHGPPGA